MEFQKIPKYYLERTEYVEALALYFYCNIKKIEFLKIIKNRNKNSLNSFPDFIISDKLYMEVARALDKKSAKIINDTNHIINASNKYNAIFNVNLRHLNQNDNYFIDYIENDNCFGLITNIPTDETLFDHISNVILEKNKKYLKKRDNSINLDLFVFCYEQTKEKILIDIFNWYKNEKTIDVFNDIYIYYLSENQGACLFIFNKQKYNIEVINDFPDKLFIKQLVEENWL